jgi:hypothetical protein
MLRKNFNCHIADIEHYSIAVLPNGEYYRSCAVLQLKIAEKNLNCHISYIADTEHYCSITERRILHKLRSCKWRILQMLNSIAVAKQRKLHIPLSTGRC